MTETDEPGSAVIFGDGGQDGRLLRALLEHRGFAVTGVSRAGVERPHRSERAPFLFRETTAWEELLGCLRPDFIFYLAGASRSSELRDFSSATGVTSDEATAVHVEGIRSVLQALTRLGLDTRVAYASSSMVFQPSKDRLIDERSPKEPQGLYAETKLMGGEVCRYFAAEHGLRASVFYLFNHESHLRPKTFLSAKVVTAAQQASLGQKKLTRLGSFDAITDWGYAPVYVHGMLEALRRAPAADYVMASGIGHTVAEFAHSVFSSIQLDYRDFLFEDSSLLVKPPERRVGNPTKLTMSSGWTSALSFATFIKKLVKNFERPRRLPIWDPPESNYGTRRHLGPQWS